MILHASSLVDTPGSWTRTGSRFLSSTTRRTQPPPLWSTKVLAFCCRRRWAALQAPSRSSTMPMATHKNCALSATPYSPPSCRNATLRSVFSYVMLFAHVGVVVLRISQTSCWSQVSSRDLNGAHVWVILRMQSDPNMRPKQIRFGHQHQH